MKNDNFFNYQEYKRQNKSKSISSKSPPSSNFASSLSLYSEDTKYKSPIKKKSKEMIEKRKSFLTEFNRSTIFSSIQNQTCLNFRNNFSDDSFEIYENILQHEFFPIIIKQKLIYLYFNYEKLYFFTKKMNFMFKFNIKEIKKISTSGRYTLVIKLYNTEENRNIIPFKNFLIKFFSVSQREYLVRKILPKTKESSNYKNEKNILTKICRDSFSYFDSFCQRHSNHLKKTGHFYYTDVYQIFDFKKNIELKLFLVLSEISNIQKIFKVIFCSIENIWFDNEDLVDMYEEILFSMRKHRDSVTVDRRRGNKKKSYPSNEEKKDKIKDSDSHEKIENLNLSRNEFIESDAEHLKTDYDEGDNFYEDEIINIRPRHLVAIKRSKTISEKNLTRFNSYNSIEEMILSKPIYDKITFNVFILKYLGKEQKILEVNNSGFFVLYKKGKSDNFISYLIQDIISLEGEPSTNSLNITTLFKAIKKVIYIEFSNSYEKYVFKTIIYNHLILTNPRYKKGTQLKLNVNIITWNVAGIDVPSDLGLILNSHSLNNIDILTIGVQECSMFKIKDWMKHLRILIGYYGYCEITSIEMCQMFIMVFIKNDLRIFVENVDSSYKPMGFANVIGNKGGVVINFKLLGYYLTFINCHLAPKPYKTLERNKNVKNLVKSIRIGDKFADFDILADYCFWQGDLNYRVDHTFHETVEEIKKNNLKLLLGKDQLIKQRMQNNVFYNFQEPEINFLPTYRRIKGSDEYSNKKDQSPSWCDRILVKTTRNLDMHYYDAIQSIRHSDHLPVLAKFSIYLTIPSFENIDKILLYQNLNGKFIYNNINVIYNFTEAFSELDIEPKFPFKMKLTGHYFINKQISESKTIEIKDVNDMQFLKFNEIYLNCPPQFVFDLPHARALNFFFVINLIIGKTTYDIGIIILLLLCIGYAKYSLENVERDNLNLLGHVYKTDIYWRTRKFGLLAFEANYKF